MVVQRKDRKPVLTDVEWWVRDVPDKGSIYAQIGPALSTDGSVTVSYHPGTPSAEATFTKTNRSIEMAQRLLAVRGFRRFKR